MTIQLLIRFLVGGLVVSLFATLGELVKPKSFAGLFSAAPSVALATLGLTLFSQGKAYAALESRSMIAGAAGFFLYAAVVARLMMRTGVHAKLAAIASWTVWFAVSFGIWSLVLR